MSKVINLSGNRFVRVSEIVPEGMQFNLDYQRDKINKDPQKIAFIDEAEDKKGLFVGYAIYVRVPDRILDEFLMVNYPGGRGK